MGFEQTRTAVWKCDACGVQVDDPQNAGWPDEEGISPPPPTGWRNIYERHFHGAACEACVDKVEAFLEKQQDERFTFFSTLRSKAED